jgi:hypothetical protein
MVQLLLSLQSEFFRQFIAGNMAAAWDFLLLISRALSALALPIGTIVPDILYLRVELENI